MYVLPWVWLNFISYVKVFLFLWLSIYIQRLINKLLLLLLLLLLLHRTTPVAISAYMFIDEFLKIFRRTFLRNTIISREVLQTV